MELKDAVELIWENRKYDTNSEAEALSHLNEEVAECLKALSRGDKVRAQAELEDALSCLFIAMKVLKIDPDEVIYRQIDRMKNQTNRTMHIFSNRVEIRVGDEIKGGWAIWSPDEIKEAQKMASEFQCQIIWEEDNPYINSESLINAQSK